jgi:hypothetical protein
MAATFITLLLVPVFFSICVLDLKIVKWETRDTGEVDMQTVILVAAGTIQGGQNELHESRN